MDMIKITILLLCLLISNITFAKDFLGTSEYFITDPSTKNIAIEFARDKAKQTALEQAGVFVTSISESSKGVMTKDDIKAVTLGFAKFKPDSEKAIFSKPNQDGSIVLSYSAIFSIDEKEIETNLVRLKQDNRAIENLKLQILSEQKALFELENRYKELQKKFTTLTTEKEKNDYKNAIVEVQNDLNAMGYFKIAVDCMTRENYKDALVYFDKTLERYSDYAYNNPAPWLTEFLASIFFQKGQIYMKGNQLAQAEAFFNSAIQIKPDYYYPYTYLALLYVMTKNESKSISAANMAVKLRPDDDQSYIARMSAYGNFGKYKEACSDFWKLKNPGPQATYAGWWYLLDKDYKNAIRVFDMALQYNPLDVPAYHGRGRANAGLKRDQDAVNDFTKAVTLDPKDFHAYAERGASYVYLKQYQLAYNDAILALSHNPNDAEALWVIAELDKKNRMK